MSFDMRNKELDRALELSHGLLKSFGTDGYIAFLELVSDDSVTLDYVSSSRVPWRVSRPGTMYRQGKEIPMQKQHRFKSLEKAIKLLKGL